MSWAARRRFIILVIVGSVFAAFLIVVLISVLYKTSSCTDGVQNQGEAGVDCGGPCPYLCTAQLQPPTVLFTTVLDNGAGRADVVAEVQNKNAGAAAKNVPYRITLYADGQALMQEIDGTLDLPPGATMPVYVHGVSEKQKVTSAFLTIAPSEVRWFAAPVDPRVVPTVLNTTQSGTSDTPRVDAVLANPGIVALSSTRTVVLVYDAAKNVIAASETVVPAILAQEQAAVTFTWNGAFNGEPVSIEIVPIIPLP